MTTWMGAGTSEGHRDAFTVAVAFGLSAVVTVLLVIVDSPADGIGFLYVLPVGLVAVDLGWRWGLGAAALCFGSYVLWTSLGDADLSIFGYSTRALVLLASAARWAGWLHGRGGRVMSQSVGSPWPTSCSPRPALRASSRG